jgi:hypothetical protein
MHTIAAGRLVPRARLVAVSSVLRACVDDTTESPPKGEKYKEARSFIFMRAERLFQVKEYEHKD